jgi:hypothetical protein
MAEHLIAALEVDFAPPAQYRFRELWRGLRAAGHPAPSAGFAEPHISLACGRGLADPLAVERLNEVVRLAGPAAPSQVVLGSVGAFAGRDDVAYLAPVVTPALLTWHAAVWDAVVPAFRDPWGYYSPGAWIPHCTMRQGPGGVAVAETLEWLRAHAGLPIAAPLARVVLRTYGDGMMNQVWEVPCR